MLAALTHPHIVTLLDGGTTDDGLPYLVMDYVEGVAIDAYCDAQRLSTTERVRLFLGVCAAVQHGHQNLARASRGSGPVEPACGPRSCPFWPPVSRPQAWNPLSSTPPTGRPSIPRGLARRAASRTWLCTAT